MSKQAPRSRKKIPNFSSEDEERRFWAKQDAADYFDWDKAAKLITEHSAPDAAALLGRDRPTWTQILEDGEPPDNEVWLASTWEVPTLEISEESSVPCWRWTDETSWDGSTYWPASALGILRGATPRTPR